MASLSIIIPVHNGARHLGGAIGGICKKLAGQGADFEVVIAEDASSDGSADMAIKAAGSNKRILLSQSLKKRGRGGALRDAFGMCSGSKIIYMDVDMATEISALEGMVRALDDNDVAVGSRYADGAKAARSPLRLFFSKCYIILVNLLAGSHFTDYQCGFKGFRRDALQQLMADAKDTGWFWDTEVLLLAKKSGMRIAEIPVRWEEAGDSTVRIFSDSVAMGRALFAHVLKGG